MSNDNFQWTDGLLKEYETYFESRFTEYRNKCMEDFKASHSPQPAVKEEGLRFGQTKVGMQFTDKFGETTVVMQSDPKTVYRMGHNGMCANCGFSYIYHYTPDYKCPGNFPKPKPEEVKQKERIEVASIVKIELPHDVDYKGIRVYSLHDIPEEKYPAIKAAIERVLNNEITLDEVAETALATIIKQNLEYEIRVLKKEIARLKERQAIPDAALEELWAAIDHWKNKYLDLKMKK